MHQKIKEWFNLYGSEIADLKNRGGSEILKPVGPCKATSLTMSEQARFLVLTGQLDALIWIFHPDDLNDPNAALNFIGEITNLMEQYEEEAKLMRSFGIKNISKGEA